MEKIAQRADLVEDEIVRANIGGVDLALYQVEGKVFASSNVCPHADCLLHENGVVMGQAVECSCHGSTYDLATGENINPPASDPLQVYPAEFRDDEVFIGQSRSEGDAVQESHAFVAYPSVEGAECPYPFYDWARINQPVYQIPGQSYFFVTRYKDLVEVAANPDRFSSVGRALGSEPTCPRTTASGIRVSAMVESDPPEHRIHRRLAAELLTPKALSSYRPMVEELSNNLIDSLIDAGECDFVTDFANKLPPLVTARMAGFADDILDQLHVWGQIEASGAPFLPAERLAEHRAVGASMLAFVTTAVRDRFEHRRDDGISRLIDLQIERDGVFDEDYVIAQASVILGGGTTTTSHMLAMAMLIMLEQDGQADHMRANSAALRLFIDEALRLEAPVQWVPRRVTEDCELGGTFLPAGSHLLLGFGSANRDPDQFEDPELFDPARRSNGGVAFGSGPHICLGLALARLELMTAFERILDRMTNIQLVPGQSLEHIGSPSFRGLKSLRIRFQKRT